jgi:hypothetical protein
VRIIPTTHKELNSSQQSQELEADPSSVRPSDETLVVTDTFAADL